jgi:hypothetical protein
MAAVLLPDALWDLIEPFCRLHRHERKAGGQALLIDCVFPVRAA